MGGRFTEPKIVIASRNRNVAPTIRGTFVDGTGLCVAIAPDSARSGAGGMLLECVGRPYNWTNRISFQTPRGTLTVQVEMKVMVLTKRASALAVKAFATLSTVFAVVYVAAYSVQT
jgi:hypothetical protein